MDGSGRLPLPAKSGPAEPPTPQALAAVIASHLDACCAGGRSLDGLIEAVAYLGADTERVSLAISDKKPACEDLDACDTEMESKKEGVPGLKSQAPCCRNLAYRSARRCGASRSSAIQVWNRDKARSDARTRYDQRIIEIKRNLEAQFVKAHQKRLDELIAYVKANVP